MAGKPQVALACSRSANRRRFRCAFLLSLAAALALDAGAALAREAGSDPAGQQAYAATVKCFVANGLAARSRKNAGDAASAAAYDAKAHQSFDSAVLLGRSIGLSGPQVSKDFDAAMATEMPKMMSDAGYFRSTAATCKAYGLM